VPLDGVFRTMTVRNVNTQCRGCHQAYRRYKGRLVQAASNAASGRRLAKLLETGG